MTDQLTQLIPIALITALIELFKLLGLPDRFVKPMAFLLGLLFAILGAYYKDLTVNIVSILTYALGAAGLYSLVLQPIKDAFTIKK